MEPKKKQQQKDVVILGGGISGLVAAFHAKKKGKSVVILEKSGRTGGVVQSEWKDGFLLEYGPNTVTPNENLMNLFASLDIQKDLLIADAKTPRYIQLKGQLHAIPLSPLQFLLTRLLSISAKVRLFMEPLVPPKKDHKDESVVNFISRRLGKEVANNLLKPFLSGVWAGDGTQLSALSSFPKLCRFESESGSILKGALSQKKKASTKKPIPKGLLSFSSGLTELISALNKNLNDSIRFHQNIVRLIPPDEDNHTWIIKTDQDNYSTPNLFSSIPSYHSAPLFSSFAPALSSALHKISYAPLILMHLSVPIQSVGRKLNGFGYLVAPAEKKNILGCLWSSSLFSNRSPKDKALLTVFMGGSLKPDLAEQSDDQLAQLALQDLSPILRLKENPSILSIKRVKQAIPQYNVGYSHIEQTIDKAEKDYKGLKFIGNIKGGISVGDVVKNAEESCKNLL